MPSKYQFQTDGIAHLKRQKKAILGDDPGLGKTRQALLAAKGDTLVVCPAILAGTWHEEIEKWLPDVPYIEVISYHQLCDRDGRKAAPRPRPEFGPARGSWGTVIFDECHRLKNRKTNWTQAAEIVCGIADQVFLLTGTPVPNWAHEIYMLLKITHPGDRRFTSYWRWVNEWFKVGEVDYGRGPVSTIGKFRPDRTWEDFVWENDLATTMLRRTREEVLPDLPPLTEQYIVVPMGMHQRRIYDELKANYISWLKGEEFSSAWSDGGLHVKLAKVGTGLSIESPELVAENKLSEADQSNKLTMLRTLMEERRDSPTVIFSQFRSTADQAQLLLADMGIEAGVIMGGQPQSYRDQTRRLFQDGKLSAIVGTLDSISEGLTFTAADTAIFMERSWRPSTNEQAMRRIHRIGQERPVSIIHLVSDDSVDQSMLKLLAEKSDQQMKMLTAHDFSELL